MKKIFFTFLTIALYFLFTTASSFASEPIQSWSTTTNLPYTLASHYATYFDGKIFVVGGATNDIVPTNLSTTVNIDGSLSSWVSTPPLLSRYWHTATQKDNRIYVLGGANSSFVDVSTVYLGVINGSGIIDNWTELTPLPTPSHLGGAVVVNDILYYAHGTTILKSPINPDGTIGAWTPAGSLPAFLTGFGLVEHNNHLILVGGKIGSNPNSAQVYESSINDDGTISSWNLTQSLPQAVNRGNVVKVGTTLFTIGGEGAVGVYSNKTYYTTINDDGTVESWQTSSHDLPHVVCCAGVAASNDYIYITGGYGNGYLDTVYYAKIGEESGLSVPLLKQTAEPWQGQEFDHANAGQFYCGTTMFQCGCATTSVAMILNYYGINKLPDGTDLDPGTLNIWLKNNNGYNRKLGIDWGVAATISKKAKDQNPNFDYGALEVDDDWTYSEAKVSNDLEQKIPNILQENTLQGMHFVVATGPDDDNVFTINDPFYDRIDLAEYGNAAAFVRRYVPKNPDASNTALAIDNPDMSYISLALDEGINIVLKDENGNPVGKTYLDYGPGNPTGDSPLPQPSPLTILEFSKPDTGNYYIELTSTTSKNFQLDVTTITEDGDIKEQTIKGVIGQNSSESFVLNFDKQSTAGSDTDKVVTFENTLEDIKELRDLHETKLALSLSLYALIKNAEDLYNKGKDNQAEKLIDAAIKLVNVTPKFFISQSAKEILLYDFNQLKSSLHN